MRLKKNHACHLQPWWIHKEKKHPDSTTTGYVRHFNFEASPTSGQKLQVPYLYAVLWGVDFPLHKPYPYSFNRFVSFCRFLHLRYLKWYQHNRKHPFLEEIHMEHVLPRRFGSDQIYFPDGWFCCSWTSPWIFQGSLGKVTCWPTHPAESPVRLPLAAVKRNLIRGFDMEPIHFWKMVHPRSLI